MQRRLSYIGAKAHPFPGCGALPAQGAFVAGITVCSREGADEPDDAQGAPVTTPLLEDPSLADVAHGAPVITWPIPLCATGPLGTFAAHGAGVLPSGTVCCAGFAAQGALVPSCIGARVGIWPAEMLADGLWGWLKV